MNTEAYDVHAIIDTMIDDLHTYLNEHEVEQPLVVGIHTAGVWLAEIIHQRMGVTEPLGELNISFYRDDFSQIGLHPQTKPSKLPFSLEGRHIILADDVLYTGRTIRAAMNELFDYGRPASIILAVLFDRDGRELPIEAQITGVKQKLAKNCYIQLVGPDDLELKIVNK